MNEGEWEYDDSTNLSEIQMNPAFKDPIQCQTPYFVESTTNSIRESQAQPESGQFKAHKMFEKSLSPLLGELNDDSLTGHCVFRCAAVDLISIRRGNKIPMHPKWIIRSFVFKLTESLF